MTASAHASQIRVRRVEPDAASWRRIARLPGPANLGHSPEWATVIHEAYGHTPLYLVAEDGAEGAGLLPAFIVRRPLVGTVVVSMPFLDGGGPCTCSPLLASRLVERLVDDARHLGARFVELRSAMRLAVRSVPTEHKVNLTLPLDGGADALWRRLDKSVRNQVRKAERSGLSVAFGGSDKLDDFYTIFAARMHQLGSPVHDSKFFRATLTGFGSRARVAIVTKDATPIGGLIALAVNGTLAVPWASCCSEYFHLCPNMLLYWRAIEAACAEGFGQFDFGRSTRGSGTYHFKRQWGAEEMPLFWYRIPLGRRGKASPLDVGHTADCLAGLWQRLPLPVTRHIGPLIRKYLIQ